MYACAELMLMPFCVRGYKQVYMQIKGVFIQRTASSENGMIIPMISRYNTI